MHLTNLDDTTRHYMRAEIELDLEDGSLYVSSRLRNGAADSYIDALREAVDGGTPESLAEAIRTRDMLKDSETAVRGGTTYTKRVPVNAADTLAEGEFNRYYARGLCRRALEEGVSQVRVYRAKTVSNPRPESQAMLGQLIDARALLDDLRTSPGVEPALGLPPGPNSGLSVELPS